MTLESHQSDEESGLEHGLPLLISTELVMIVAECTRPAIESNAPVKQRRRMILEAVCRVIDADLFCWGCAQMDFEQGNGIMHDILVGGPAVTDVEKSTRIMLDLSHREDLVGISKKIFRKHEVHVTKTRHEFISAPEWFLKDFLQVFRDRKRLLGVDELMITMRRSGNLMCGVNYQRNIGKPPFTLREKLIARIADAFTPVISEIDHTGVPFALSLKPKLREQLVYELQYYTVKEMAELLFKGERAVQLNRMELFRHFNVKTQGELIRHFRQHG